MLARLLPSAWASPAMPELVAPLTVTGLDGTQRCSNAPPGRAQPKSGSLRDVAGVPGFVLSNSGRRYALVAIVNHAKRQPRRGAHRA